MGHSRRLRIPAGMPLLFSIIGFLFLIATPIQNNIIRFHEHQADMFGLNAAREPDGFAESALLLSEYRKMEPSPFEEWFFYDHPRAMTASTWRWSGRPITWRWATFRWVQAGRRQDGIRISSSCIMTRRTQRPPRPQGGVTRRTVRLILPPLGSRREVPGRMRSTP